jgi:hypothetical protein
MTLAEVLPGAQQLTAPEKLQLIRILAADLDIAPSPDATSLDAVWHNDNGYGYLSEGSTGAG